ERRKRRLRRTAAPANRRRLRRRPPVHPASRRNPTQIVEPDLRNRKPAQLRSRLRVEIAQQPIAQPVVRNRAQLLLDQLERTPKRRSPRQRLSKINTPDIQPHRAYADQPPPRARQIHSRRCLLPTTT